MTKQYLDLSKKILSEGEYEWIDRTETGTLSLFGGTTHYNLREGFPLLTTKKTAWRMPIEEMLFFLRGENNLGVLLDKEIPIWNANGFDFYLRRNGLTEKFPKHSPEWRVEFKGYINRIKFDLDFREKEGTLGRIYGVQARDWRDSKGRQIDQLKNFFHKLKNDSTSRSNIVTHFNPGELDEMALGPCHLLYQSRVVKDDNNRLDILMFQRSCDYLLGIPFNVAQYAFLIEMAAKETNLTPGIFAHSLGNFHYYLGIPPRSDFLANKKNLKEFKGRIKAASKSEDYLDIKEWYLNHAPFELEGTEGTDQIPFALIQLSREPKKQPVLEFKLNKGFNFWEAIKMDAKDLIEIRDYNPYPKLEYEFNGKLIKPFMSA